MLENSIKLGQLVVLVEQKVPGNGLYQAALEHLSLFRESRSRDIESVTYKPVLIVAAQGAKQVLPDLRRWILQCGVKSDQPVGRQSGARYHRNHGPG